MKHTSNTIIFDDEWSSFYTFHNAGEWGVVIRKDGNSYCGKGQTLSLALQECEGRIERGEYFGSVHGLGRLQPRPPSKDKDNAPGSDVKLDELF